MELMPDEPEVRGLLALMLLQHSRRDARTDASGRMVLLEDQDRSRWDAAAIEEGLALARRGPPLGRYGLQAAIAAEHAREGGPDWSRIARLYEPLAAITGSPVVELNRAVAVAMADGPAAGLEVVDRLGADLEGYHLMHAARADMLRRLDRREEAAAGYRRALELATNPIEREFLERRMAEVSA
jgi:RNA polymerase sigma-70 factor (ECF subfamily)